jgi:hypothetical protein
MMKVTQRVPRDVPSNDDFGGRCREASGFFWERTSLISGILDDDSVSCSFASWFSTCIIVDMNFHKRQKKWILSYTCVYMDLPYPIDPSPLALGLHAIPEPRKHYIYSSIGTLIAQNMSLTTPTLIWTTPTYSSSGRQWIYFGQDKTYGRCYPPPLSGLCDRSVKNMPKSRSIPRVSFELAHLRKTFIGRQISHLPLQESFQQTWAQFTSERDLNHWFAPKSRHHCLGEALARNGANQTHCETGAGQHGGTIPWRHRLLRTGL